ncbi:Taurine catabolism dioxygenase TauD, TfdA family [Moraxella cuniculi DSM 21768]|uniref:Taurine catabolism dioxygenase TauD, TfdA family n=2 Tax=Moraxella cuniculi TaxID=34061 RepID=A0A1N7E6R0_9GAMM|nr:Taurine catabolism dioxygenase TauD, TfdA family [Moraxella cuniculi DSM 21768]
MYRYYTRQPLPLIDSISRLAVLKLAYQQPSTSGLQCSPYHSSLGLPSCPKTHEAVATSIIRLDDALDDLSNVHLQRLQEPCFDIHRPASFQNHAVCRNLPLIVRHDGYFVSRFDYHNVHTTSPEHIDALNSFKALSTQQKHWRKITLTAGQVLSFDNQRVLHTRSDFSPKFDSTDRWLVRVFGLYQAPDHRHFFADGCRHHLKIS